MKFIFSRFRNFARSHWRMNNAMRSYRRICIFRNSQRHEATCILHSGARTFGIRRISACRFDRTRTRHPEILRVAISREVHTFFRHDRAHRAGSFVIAENCRSREVSPTQFLVLQILALLHRVSKRDASIRDVLGGKRIKTVLLCTDREKLLKFV